MLDVKPKKAHILTANKKLVDWLLSLNTNNRHLRKSHVAWMQQAIIDGEFILTGHGIAVSEDGVLLDGQHRLSAIKAADYPPVEIMVVTGLDKKAQMYVDQHAKRTTADMLRLTLDKTISNKMSAVLTFLLKMREEDGVFIIGGKNKPSLQQIHDKMADELEDLIIVTDATGQKIRTGAVAAIYDYYTKYNKDAAIEFAIQVRDGEMLKKDAPAYALRRYLNTHTHNGGSQSIETYRHAVTACIAHSQSRRVDHFRPSNTWRELGQPNRKKQKIGKKK